MSELAVDHPDQILSGFIRPRVSITKHEKILLPDKLAFFRQMNTLFTAGTPLYDALVIASEQTESKGLSRVVANIADKVASGESFSAALESHEEHFKSEWVQLVRSGEISGKLGDVLVRLAAQIDEASQFRSKVISALMYPMIVMCVSFGAVAVMLIFVVPTFAQMFEEMDKELPALTVKVMALSDFLRAYWHYLIGGVVGGLIFFKRWIKTTHGAVVWSKALVSAPLMGDLIVQSSMRSFAQNISALLRAGVPVLDSLDALKGIYKSNPVYRAAMKRTAQHVGRGGNLADGLEATGVFTAFLANMIRIGERTGQLPDVMSEVSVFYSRKVETVVTRIASNIETILIVMMGAAIALILTALYLPLFEMAT
jgi:type IV pilus assembly protein PilC